MKRPYWAKNLLIGIDRSDSAPFVRVDFRLMKPRATGMSAIDRFVIIDEVAPFGAAELEKLQKHRAQLETFGVRVALERNGRWLDARRASEGADCGRVKEVRHV